MHTGLLEHLNKASLEVLYLLNVAFNVLWNAIDAPQVRLFARLNHSVLYL